MSRLHAFVLLVLASLAQAPPAAAKPVCDETYCDCSRATHPDWVVVHCVVPPDKKIYIHRGDLPRNTTDLVITGAESVLFDTNSLSDLKDARFIRISGPKVILIKKYAAVNLNVVSLYLHIQNCDVLDIEEQTFTNIKGPLSLAIHNCDTVSIDGETFSWLLTADIADVRQLQLRRGSFTLESTANQALQGDHGPFMTIELKNLSIPVLPSQSFSSAARISMLGVTVDELMPDAFSANTYNIVIAINSTFKVVHGEAFAQKSLVNNLFFEGCTIERLAMGAIQSAVGHLNIKESNFENIESAAVKITVATIKIANSTFMNTIEERGFELSSWNKFVMQGNSFDELAPNAFVAPGANIHELIFVENSIRTVNPNSLGFIGETQANAADSIVYKSNYFGHQCHCDVTAWIAEVLGAKSGEPFVSESFCTVDEFFARCFNVPDLNMKAEQFIAGVCSEDSKIFCEPFKTKTEGQATEIKNPRFPEKDKSSEVLSERDKKVIGIVIVTALGCVVIVLFISLIKWMRRKGYCLAVKNLLVSSNSNCTSFCDRFCTCTRNSGLDNAESISRLSVHEYSERHRLNEPRIEIIQETTLPLPDMYTEEPVPSEDKTTQTLPEELTKELLESLKEKLDDPENYVEAREMIEHLYELIKVEESCNVNSPVPPHAAENIYELPFQNTVPRLGRNKKKMISVSTRTPSLDKLLPLSPYNRQTALAHEYFEPKDFAIHLYAEIENRDRDKKGMLNLMPDLVGEQAVPRGPYLRAVRDKVSAGSTSSSPSANSHSHMSLSPAHTGTGTATIRSNNSIASNSSGKMINRPLPEKPIGCGETSSLRHG